MNSIKVLRCYLADFFYTSMEMSQSVSCTTAWKRILPLRKISRMDDESEEKQRQQSKINIPAEDENNTYVSGRTSRSLLAAIVANFS